MFDVFQTHYQMRCPVRDEMVGAPLSSFRRVTRLDGAIAPAVYRVEFDCECGETHPALLAHDALDFEPLATETSAVFLNLQTGSRELVAAEMGHHASDLIRQGKWPWTFYCYAEAALRPGFPSSLRMLSPVEHVHGQRHGALVKCASCGRMTINLVSRDHLDVPFYNDEVLHFVRHMVNREAMTAEEAFRHELDNPTALSSVRVRAA